MIRYLIEFPFLPIHIAVQFLFRGRRRRSKVAGAQTVLAVINVPDLMSVPISRLTDISIFCLVCIGDYPGSCDRRRGGVAKRVIAKAVPEPW